MNNCTPTIRTIKEAPIPHQMERIPWKWQHMGTCWPSPCPWTYQALSICSSSSVSCKNNPSVSNTPSTYKNPSYRPPNPHQMPNDLPHFPIKQLPKDFPIEKLTPLKLFKYDFNPSEPHSHSIFCFCYKLSTTHVSIHSWYCKLSYCPFHHHY